MKSSEARSPIANASHVGGDDSFLDNDDDAAQIVRPGSPRPHDAGNLEPIVFEYPGEYGIPADVWRGLDPMMFRIALWIPGMLHIVSNMQQEVLQSMPAFDQGLEDAKKGKRVLRPPMDSEAVCWCLHEERHKCGGGIGR